MANENAPKKTFWQQVAAVCKNPISTISDKTKDSPLITILAIVFILQPVFSTGVDVVKEMIEVRHQLDPANRPVTKGELDIVNTKIDFIQQLIVTDMQKDAAAEQDSRRYRHQHGNEVAATATPPANTAAPVTATPTPPPPPANTVASVAPPVTASTKAADIRSRFSDLNKRLEVIQAPLDKKFSENRKQ